jgi:signal transduction histidine kinase
LVAPDRAIRVVLAAASVAIGIAAAVHRGLFAAPGWQWAALALAVGPFVVDARWPLTRRRWPGLAGLAVPVSGIAALLVAAPPGPDVTSLLLLVVAARVGGLTSLWVSVPVVVATLAGLLLLGRARPGVGSEAMLFGVAFAWSAGVAMRMRADLVGRLLRAQTALAAAAAAEERQRMARDIHDVIAHTMSVTMLQLAGARLALAEGECDEAMDSLRRAESSGRAAMADIRQTIGLLREPGSAGLPASVDLADLVSSFVDAGLKVDYRVGGDPTEMPVPVADAVFGIVREALSNAARYAVDGAARVEVSVTAGDTVLSVSNAYGGASIGHGHGVAGMRHRARLVGATLTAGPAGDRWLVSATFPGRAG